MEQEPTTNWTFPMECPECRERMGFPFSSGTTIERFTINLALRCHACNHEWRLTMPTRRSAHASLRRPLASERRSNGA